MSRLEISGLTKRYGSMEVLRDINLDVASGEFTVFVGPSGCGKSTLLRCIAALEPFSQGTIAIDGKDAGDVPIDQRGVAMVFQSYALYPHMTVFDNIAFALQLHKMPKAEIEAKVLDVAKKLQLTPYLDRLPALLSGGQRQRVAIGRAIVRDPKIFLFDEPLSNLDAELRVQMRMELAQLKAQLPNTTMIYVTHDQVEAMTLADRIVVLNAGRMEDIGSPEDLFERPKNKFIAGFLGSPKMNFVEGERAEKYRAHTIGIRPEGLTLSARKKNGWPGTVSYVEYLGSDAFAFIDIGNGSPLVVRLPGKDHPQSGDQVSVQLDPDHVHRFDADGIALNA